MIVESELTEMRQALYFLDLALEKLRPSSLRGNIEDQRDKLASIIITTEESCRN